MRYLATILAIGLFSLAAVSQTSKPRSASSKPKTTIVKPKPAATPAKKPDEKTQWETTLTISEPAARIRALKRFIQTFPDSDRSVQAAAMISSSGVESGNAKLQGGDIPGAAELFRTAASGAPEPVPDTLFNDALAKIPANLYFRGDRQGAYDIAKILEQKAAANAGQLIALSTFYLTVENGSEARRLAESAIKIDPSSSAAYETLGLANRMDFQLEDSAAAYTKSLELAPASLSARRGLAEMKRSLGRADEAIALYQEIVTKDETALPARTGLTLAMFDAGKRTEAEAELARALDANPGNVILLAGAAYWYAAHSEGLKAVELARKAIDADPRFIWSHIALARGYMSLGNGIDAERTLVAARRYGNFPTLEYEIASARLTAGYYREAADELAKSFTVSDGVVKTKLGGRVERGSKDFTELVGFERRASIFTPTAADNPDNAAKLTALLELKQELAKPEPAAETTVRLANEFIKGSDPMKVHRQLYTATQLLDKKIALQEVVEIARAATANIDAGLSVTSPSAAVMASELYENRLLAASRGEYLNVPEVPRPTLSAILRGRVEEISGWALFQIQDPTASIVHLKRAVSVLPVDSIWWRSSTWRLAMALALAGKDAEALDMYIKSYKSSGTSIQYGVITDLYTRIHGSTEGLDEKISGIAKAAVAVTTPESVETSTAEIIPSPTPARLFTAREARIPAAVPIATAQVTAVVTEPTPQPTREVVTAVIEPIATPESVPLAQQSVETTPVTEKPAIVAAATPEPSAEATPLIEIT
ncbi:MAG: tetratricopeptide repeat protein, partial [Pyrinomonadaceae bacterium]